MQYCTTLVLTYVSVQMLGPSAHICDLFVKDTNKLRFSFKIYFMQLCILSTSALVNLSSHWFVNLFTRERGKEWF